MFKFLLIISATECRKIDGSLTYVSLVFFLSRSDATEHKIKIILGNRKVRGPRISNYSNFDCNKGIYEAKTVLYSF